MVGHGRGLGFDIVGIGEGIVRVVLEDRELVVLVAAVGLADVVRLFVKGAGLSELGQRARDVPATGGGGLLEASTVSTVASEFGIEGEEADERVDCDAEKGKYEGNGQDVENGATGGASNEECNVDDDGGKSSKPESEGQAEFRFDSDTEACGVGDFAAGTCM